MLVAVPSSVVTVMGPLGAPTGTAVVTVPELLTVNVAGCPLNETAVAPVKFVPVIVTPVPAGPVAGAKELMAGVIVKRVVVTKGPPGVVMVMGPVVAPVGTVVVIVPEASTVKAAATPLNETAVAPVKPVIVTPVPEGPKIGANGLKLIPSSESDDVVGCGGRNRVRVDGAGKPSAARRVGEVRRIIKREHIFQRGCGAVVEERAQVGDVEKLADAERTRPAG